MTNNQSRGIAIDNSIITNHSDQCLERLAQLIHIPSVALQPYKNECIVRQYNKGQVIYYSSDELTHIYYLIDGYILREQFSMNGDVYRILNKDDKLFPMHNLFQEKTTNEMCTAITDCILILLNIYVETMTKCLLEFTNCYVTIRNNKLNIIWHSVLKVQKNA